MNFMFYVNKKDDTSKRLPSLTSQSSHLMPMDRSKSIPSLTSKSMRSAGSFIWSYFKKKKGSSRASIDSTSERKYNSTEFDSSFKISRELENIAKLMLPKSLECMPYCAEKIILKLEYICSLVYLPHSSEDISVDIDFKAEVQSLHERLNVEELFTAEVKYWFLKVKDNLNEKDYKSSIENLKECLALLRDLNIQKMLRMANLNGESLRLVRGKSVCMLLGLKGSGKTTTLNFLSGSKINKTLVKSLASSLTEVRYIKPVTVKLDKRNGFADDSVLFCDSAVLEDTTEIEIYIANRVAFRRCVEACSGVKPVLLATKTELEESGQFSALAKALADIFTNLEHDLEHVGYVYTHFEKSEQKQSEVCIIPYYWKFYIYENCLKLNEQKKLSFPGSSV